MRGGCEWLCLDNGRIYFECEKSVYSMCTDGTGLQTEYENTTANYLESINHAENTLYFIEECTLCSVKDGEKTIVFDSDTYNQNLQGSDEAIVSLWIISDYKITAKGIYILMNDHHNRNDIDGRLLYLSNKSNEAKFIDDAGVHLTQNGNTVYYEHAEIDEEKGVSYRFASSRNGKKPKVFGRTVDPKYLYYSAGCLYYCNYEEDPAALTAKPEENSLESGNYVSAYILSSGKDCLVEPTIRYSSTLGIAGNYFWYESGTKNIWVKLGDTSDQAEHIMSDKRLTPTGVYGPGSSYLLLTAPADKMAAYRLIRDDTVNTVQFFIIMNPGEEREMEFPSGKYVLKTAEGDEWISDSDAFGSSGSYSQTDPYDFEAGYEYWITAGTTSDFRNDNQYGFMK